MALRNWALPCLLILSPPAAAQYSQGQQGLSAVQRAISGATTRVFVFAPWLKSQPVADSLRTAMVQRGIKVTILTSSSTLVEPGSYFLGLKLAGADLRTTVINNLETSGPFVLVDDRILLTTTSVLSSDPYTATTRQITDIRTINSYRDWAARTTKISTSIHPTTAAYLLAYPRLKKDLR